MALEIYSITEGGAGRDLRDQQLGHFAGEETEARSCLLYTSDAADEERLV